MKQSRGELTLELSSVSMLYSNLGICVKCIKQRGRGKDGMMNARIKMFLVTLITVKELTLKATISF